MAFVRAKEVHGRLYYQLVENRLENGKITQRVILHLGNESKAAKYCKKHNIPFSRVKPKIASDSFFDSTRQSAEFLVALRGRKEVPLKFEYVGEGASKWMKLVHSPAYGLGSRELELINQHSSQIVKEVGKSNLIDVGCGTGEKAVPFIRRFSRILAPKYIAFDISGEMLKLAEKQLKRSFSGLNAEFVLADFEQTNLAQEMLGIREKYSKKSLFLFLGNTIGNVSDKSRVLTNLRESMTLEDNLLIGLELFDLGRISEILDHYRKSAEWKNNVLNVLNHYGITEKDGAVQVVFNKEKSQVEAHFKLRKRATITVANKKISLKKGESILLMVSYKGTPKKLQVLLADAGFIILRLFLSKREDYALILCKPAKI